MLYNKFSQKGSVESNFEALGHLNNIESCYILENAAQRSISRLATRNDPVILQLLVASLGLRNNIPTGRLSYPTKMPRKHPYPKKLSTKDFIMMNI
jgi:hypothetical protein